MWKNNSKMLQIRRLVLTLLLTQIVAIGQQEKTAIEGSKADVKLSISYCNLNISQAKKLANLSFNVLYRFDVDENGTPVNVRKMRDDYVGEEIVKPCISEWRLTGISERTKFFAYFFWSHNKGWFRQTVNNAEFSLVMEGKDVGMTRLLGFKGQP